MCIIRTLEAFSFELVYRSHSWYPKLTAVVDWLSLLTSVIQIFKGVMKWWSLKIDCCWLEVWSGLIVICFRSKSSSYLRIQRKERIRGNKLKTNSDFSFSMYQWRHLDFSSFTFYVRNHKLNQLSTTKFSCIEMSSFDPVCTENWVGVKVRN